MSTPIDSNNKPPKKGCPKISGECVRKNYKIYVLVHPISKSIRYVGFTGQNLKKRLNEHLTIDCKFYKGKWINQLKKQNLTPEILLIEENLTLDSVKIKEIEYIKLYKDNGHKLTNLTKGGDGGLGHKVSEEHKLKLRNLRIGSNNHFYGKKHSEESLNKMKEKQKGVNNGFYGKQHTKESKKKISDASKKQIRHKGSIHSQETKDKISMVNKGKVRSDEIKKQISNKLKGRIFTEQHKLKLKQAWDLRKSNTININQYGNTN